MPAEKTRKIRLTFACCFLFLFLFNPFPGSSQTEIGGVINTYSRVLGAGECPNVISVDSPQNFTVGQLVLLIGMQGAEMSIENDNTFGQVSSGGLTAGRYDWTVIENIQGNEIILRDPISEGYDFMQSVQLVGVPVYEDAIVVNELNPMPWDGNLGGVLALEVTGTLELSADVSATGLGFRGGQSVQAADDNCTLLTSANNYFYENGSWRGAPKGEGIVPIVNGRELGRGPQANGGGGANTHNSGGGGGSNRTRGGLGGENREPSFGGCKGFFPGLGGHPLDFGTDHWFMGGGGGAGHRNNTSMSSGGNGGGIIVIKAGTLAFNGGVLRSDGLDGLPASGDGAGGGGSGGTIVLDIENISGTPTISARGGRGGDVNNMSERCMGPGGGGSGGQVYSTLMVTPELSGGDPGLTLGSSVCPVGPNGALAGENGGWEMAGIKAPDTSLSLEIINTPADTSICPGEALDLVVEIAPIDYDLGFQWMVNNNGDWIPLEDGQGFAGTNTSTLTVDNLQSDAAFQLVLSTDCTESLTSEPIQVTVSADGGPTADFSYLLDGFSAVFTNLSQGATTYEWTIEEIPFYSSTDPDPEFTFPAYGTYQVNLRAMSSCGEDVTSQIISIGGPPVADFFAMSTGSKCVPLTVQWADQSQGIFETYQWSFPGGTPSTSVEPNPVVVYEQAGEFDVTLTVSGPLGNSTKTQERVVKVFSVPQPAFSYDINGLSVNFLSMADTGMVHIWSFDDGNISQEKDPTHTFSVPGAYDVTLNLQNGGCASSLTQTVLAFTTDVHNRELEPHLQLYPNPTLGPLQIQSGNPELFPLDLYLFDAKGQLLQSFIMQRSGSMSLADYSSGVYYLLMHSSLGTGSWRVIKH